MITITLFRAFNRLWCLERHDGRTTVTMIEE